MPSRSRLTDALVRRLVDTAPDAMVVVDSRGHIVLVNAATGSLR